MNFWKIILATVVIFAAGVFAGVLTVKTIKEKPVNPTAQNSFTNSGPQGVPLPSLPPQARLMNRDFLKKLDSKLKLTPEQRAKIEKIVAEGQERNHELWTNVAPKMREVMLDVDRQIREQLAPEQQKDFEELLKQFRAPRKPKNTNAPSVTVPTNTVPAAATNAQAINCPLVRQSFCAAPL